MFSSSRTHGITTSLHHQEVHIEASYNSQLKNIDIHNSNVMYECNKGNWWTDVTRKLTNRRLWLTRDNLLLGCPILFFNYDTLLGATSFENLIVFSSVTLVGYQRCASTAYHVCYSEEFHQRTSNFFSILTLIDVVREKSGSHTRISLTCLPATSNHIWVFFWRSNLWKYYIGFGVFSSGRKSNRYSCRINRFWGNYETADRWLDSPNRSFAV